MNLSNKVGLTFNVYGLEYESESIRCDYCRYATSAMQPIFKIKNKLACMDCIAKALESLEKGE